MTIHQITIKTSKQNKRKNKTHQLISPKAQQTFFWDQYEKSVGKQIIKQT